MKNKIVQFVSGVYLAAGPTSSSSPTPPKGIDSTLFRNIGNLFGGGPGSLAKSERIGDLIIVLLQILLLVAASVAVIFLVIGGYQYVVSRGNEEGTEKAKKTITSAVLGIIVIIMAFVIIRLVAAILLNAPGPEDLGVG